MIQIGSSISVSLGAGRSVIIDYQYSRAALNLLQQVDLNDIDTIKEHYKDLPRTIKNIPKHFLEILTESSAIDKTIKLFSGLNTTDQRRQAEYWKQLPKAMKDLYKNNINIQIEHGLSLLVLLCCVFRSLFSYQVSGPEYHRGSLIARQAQRIRALERKN